MDMFKNFMGDMVDLDDESNYDNEYTRIKYGGTARELWDKCLYEIGYSHMYMNFLSDTAGDWNRQQVRVDELCKELALHDLKRREDSAENRLWFKKFIYRFTDEIENMC